MHKKNCSILLLCFHIVLAQDNPLTVTVTNTNNNSMTSDNKLSTKRKQTKIKKQTSIPQSLSSEHVASSPIPKEPYLQQFKRTCADHPYLIAAGILVSICYLATLSSMYGIKYMCNNRCKWAFWHDELSAQQLKKCSCDDVCKALFATIEDVYDQEKDALPPVMHFIDDVTQELAWHNSFLSLTQWLDKTHLALLFPQQKTAVAHITRQRDRLIVLRSVCITGLSTATGTSV